LRRSDRIIEIKPKIAEYKLTRRQTWKAQAKLLK
jgi:hypothetical protein